MRWLGVCGLIWLLSEREIMANLQTFKKALGVHTEALSRALKLLDAAGAQYCVIAADGQKYGALEIKEPAGKKQRHQAHPRGAFLDHHKPYTKDLKPGDSVVVPYGPFSSEMDRESLRSSLSGWSCRAWGAGNYITEKTEAGIEVLRVE